MNEGSSGPRSRGGESGQTHASASHAPEGLAGPADRARGIAHPANLLTRYEGNPILTAADWPYPCNSVFNPGATRLSSGETLLLCRVEDRRGQSHLCAARSQDGLTGWTIDEQPTLHPDPARHPEEVWGIEDPRITHLAELDRHAIVYTVYSRGGPGVSLALTEDFRDFKRVGQVMPPEDKDAALFPRRIGRPGDRLRARGRCRQRDLPLRIQVGGGRRHAALLLRCRGHEHRRGLRERAGDARLAAGGRRAGEVRGAALEGLLQARVRGIPDFFVSACAPSHAAPPPAGGGRPPARTRRIHGPIPGPRWPGSQPGDPMKQSHESSRTLGALPLVEILVSSMVLPGAALAAPAGGQEHAKPAAARLQASAEAGETIASFEALLASPGVCGEPCYASEQCSPECNQRQGHVEALAIALQTNEGAFEVLRPVVVERFRDAATSSQARRAILDLFAWKPCESVAELATQLFAIDPAVFTTDHMLAYAEGAPELFVPCLEKRMRAHDPRDRFLAAVYFAGRGDPSAEAVLASCLVEPCSSAGGVTRAFLAAALLEKLGQPSRIEALTQQASDWALAALDSGDLERARRIALEASFGRKMAEQPGYVAPHFDREIEGKIAWGSRAEGAEGIFALIERLQTL